MTHNIAKKTKAEQEQMYNHFNECLARHYSNMNRFVALRILRKLRPNQIRVFKEKLNNHKGFKFV